MKKVTIIIPAFNSAHTIEATLSSIALNIDICSYISTIYIADDYSNDQTINKCIQTWNVSQIDLKIIRSKQNNGERVNVNHAIKQISKNYEWVLLIHSDDLAKSHWVSTVCKEIAICEKNTASICSSYDVLFENGKIEIGENKTGRTIIEGNAENIKNTLINGTWWHISGCAINLPIFEITGGFHPKMPQYGDMEWLIRCLKSKYNFLYIPQSLTTYRQHQSSVSSISFKKHLDIHEHLLLVKDNLRYLSKQDQCMLLSRFKKVLVRRAISSIIKMNFKRFSSAQKMLRKLKNQFKE